MTTKPGEGTEASPSTRPPRRMHVKSFGCQMNVYDATRMVDMLAPEGFEETATVEDADLVVLNTCHIREQASEKVFSELGKLRVLKNERNVAGRGLTIAVAGCVAQAEGREIIHRQPAVDLVVGPQTYHRLPELLRQARGRPGIVDTEFPAEDKFDHLRSPEAHKTRARGVSAFVTIQEGCDKFCTFCVVPYTRGAEVSRPVEQILTEVAELARAGVREVTLLGQNVNGYHGLDTRGRRCTLADLAYRLADVPGIARIRYMTSHPNDMDDALIAAHRDLRAFMPFLHLPVQSGSDRILEAMNRKHSAETYLQIIERVREARPDIALSSDFIVGFPGETDEDFEATLALIERVRYASVFSFKYSPRPGTPGADLSEQVPEDVKRERLARLQALVDEHRHSFNRACIGSTFDVLIEKTGRHPGQIVGKTPYLQAIHLDGSPDLIGRIVDVDVVAVAPNSLVGRLAGPSGRGTGERV